MTIDLSITDLIRFAVGVLIAATGVVCLALFAARIRRRDDSLLYFGLAAGMYGTRLLLEATHQDGGTADLLITLLILVPLILFLVETVAPAWKRAAPWMVAVVLAVAVFGVGTRLVGLNQSWARYANNGQVLLAIPVFLAMAYLPRRPPDHDLQVFRAGLIVFSLFVVYANLAGLGLFPAANVEFIGFSINLCCLGYVAVARTQRNEERLLSLHKELEIAQNIQSQLLPKSGSTIQGTAIASRYVPASSVAGDFYDFLANDGGLGVLIADVSGHGIPAALSASMVKVAVRAQTDRAGNPAEVLHGMNSILCGNLQGQFVSAAYLFLDTAHNQLVYSAAGHPPLLVWRSRQQRVESLEENGLLLGIFPGTSYKAKTAPLSSGDRCLLYTDGLVEAPSPSGEEFGTERLKEFLTRHASLPPQPFCDALVDDVARWCGKLRPLPDDVTIVLLAVSS